MTNIPTRMVGPIQCKGPVLEGNFLSPMATFEKPLWPSTARGAHVTRETDGVNINITRQGMTRSIVLESTSASDVIQAAHKIERSLLSLQDITQTTSRFCQLINLSTEVVGNLLFIRFQFDTKDASGHNMATKASDAIMQHLLLEYPVLRYVSISGNMCTDKKASAINGIMGRGKHVVADMLIPYDVCVKLLRATPTAIHALNIKKNLVGSILAGSIRSANAHYANMLLAIYLATGQDAANIVEGSQGVTYTDVIDNDLYFSITLPNIIVGTIGNGKDHPDILENLAKSKILDAATNPGDGAERLAALVAATVFCGELSLLAAQTNPGELVQSHMRIER